MRLSKLPVAAAIGAAVLAGCNSGSTKSPNADITVTSCAADPAGGKPRASGTIVNHSSKPSGYTFRVRFVDAAGNVVTDAPNGVGRVEPNATANWTALGNGSAKGPLTCKLTDQTRAAVGT